MSSVRRQIAPSLWVSNISFGTASLHHLWRKQDRIRLLRSANEIGITHFDTSPFYGYGVAESALGAAFRESRNSITIATKFGIYPPGWSPGLAGVWGRKALGKVISSVVSPQYDWSVARAKLSLRASLQRLETDCVDLLLVHEPLIRVDQADELLRWLEVEHKAGLLRNWGIAGQLDLHLRNWLKGSHPLARILQCEDSLEHKEADGLRSFGRDLGFTYGYLRNASIGKSAAEILTAAVKRNSTGSVLVSTRRLDRLKAFESVLE